MSFIGVPDVHVLAARGAESGLLELEVFPDLAQNQLFHRRLRLPLAVHQPRRLRQLPVVEFLLIGRLTAD